jgi:UDP-3-O-[3-hydroxymyristoyl] glucosamine N-acyltransferase
MIDLTPVITHLQRGSQILDSCDELGYVVWKNQNFLSFISDSKYINSVIENDYIKAVLWDTNIPVPPIERGVEIIPCKNPLTIFTLLQNSLSNPDHFAPNEIHASAIIGDNVSLASSGVKIAQNVTVESHATIFSGVSIGPNSIVRSGARIGSDALDVKRDFGGKFLMTNHLGSVSVEDNVEIGHNSVVDRAVFRHQTTRIGAQSKVGALSNISHGVSIGKNNIIAAGVQICGSTTIGDDNWFGPSSVISHMLSIGNGNFVALGSQVFRDLEDGWKVVGTKVFRERHLF